MDHDGPRSLVYSSFKLNAAESAQSVQNDSRTNESEANPSLLNARFLTTHHFHEGSGELVSPRGPAGGRVVALQDVYELAGLVPDEVVVVLAEGRDLEQVAKEVAGGLDPAIRELTF